MFTRTRRERIRTFAQEAARCKTRSLVAMRVRFKHGHCLRLSAAKGVEGAVCVCALCRISRSSRRTAPPARCSQRDRTAGHTPREAVCATDCHVTGSAMPAEWRKAFAQTATSHHVECLRSGVVLAVARVAH